MKLWVKVLIVFLSGGAVWGLSFVGTLESMDSYAMALSLASGAIASACTALTGFVPTKTS
jgi:vacuolar-type H+-ATPase subunit I/STV1